MPSPRRSVLTGCAQDLIFSDVNRDTVEVLARNGCEVITPPKQNCCGSLHAHNGEWELAQQLARQLPGLRRAVFNVVQQPSEGDPDSIAALPAAVRSLVRAAFADALGFLRLGVIDAVVRTAFVAQQFPREDHVVGRDRRSVRKTRARIEREGAQIKREVGEWGVSVILWANERRRSQPVGRGASLY